MKLRIACLLTSLLALSASAKGISETPIKNAFYYIINAWVGEYPPGYVITEERSFWGVKDVSNPILSDESCTLPKGTVIHPWAVKTQSDFITMSPIQIWELTEDVEFVNETPMLLKKGEQITQLSALSEGICLLEYKGKQFEDSCLDFFAYGDAIIPVYISPFAPQSYFKSQCMEDKDRALWIHIENLEYAIGDGVEYAEIVDYGEVKESN